MMRMSTAVEYRLGFNDHVFTEEVYDLVIPTCELKLPEEL